MQSDHFRMLAGYNAWANSEIYGAVAGLPEAEYRKTRPCAYFGSIHATLNHILLGDRLWFTRAAGESHAVTGLDQILYEGFDDLRAAREAEDAGILAFTEGLDEAAISGTRRFRLVSEPGEKTMRIGLMLATVFNHQTHHRGQVHAMLKEAGVEPPSLDLIVYPGVG
jgi:uncharacterized damage-inducible protein DinB